MSAEETNVSPSLPSYPQMIYAALDELNEKMGSNKTSISKVIETKYEGNLPTGHNTLLRHHLTKMKDNGELIFWKNNYMKPDPSFIRRGRGRPPKGSKPNGNGTADGSNGNGTPDGGVPPPAPPASSLVLGASVGTGKAKGRGRPRKDTSANQEVYDAVAVPLADVDDEDDDDNNDGGAGAGADVDTAVKEKKRGRGRPPKLPKVDNNGGTTAAPPAPAGSGKPRGRPPKAKSQESAVGSD